MTRSLIWTSETRATKASTAARASCPGTSRAPTLIAARTSGRTRARRTDVVIMPSRRRTQTKGAFVGSDTLSGGILALVWNAGPIAKFVLIVLMIFSIVSWALIVEKTWQFRRIRRQTFEFLRVFREARRPSVVHNAARKLRQSPLAQLYFAAYQEVSGIPEVLDKVLDDLDEGLGADRLEAVSRAPRRAAALEVARLEPYLPFLATTPSAPPFLGLFGTARGGVAGVSRIGAQGPGSPALV